MREIRTLWQQVSIIYNKSSSSPSTSNVLLLQSSQLSELINVLCSVDDSIEIHPRQIRRILRRALDSNVVKDIATSRPNSFLKQPIFNKVDNKYVLRIKHYETESQQTGNICYDFYFGVPKSYYLQIKTITNLCNKQNMMNDIENVSEIKTPTQKHKSISNMRRNNESPLKTMIGFATDTIEPTIQRINSKSFQSRSSIVIDTTLEMNNDEQNEGIEMTDMTEMTEITENVERKPMKSDRKHRITLQRLIPNEFVYHDFVESKCVSNADADDDITFCEKDLEKTINTIIGNIKKRELIKKRGPSTKYKRYIKKRSEKQRNDRDGNAVNAANTEEDIDEFYFCVVLSYIRYRIENEKEEEKDNEDESKYNDDCNEYESYSENGINYKIETLEISMYDPPSAFLPRNEYKKRSKKKKDKEDIKTLDDNIAIENALEPGLCFKLLCDFKLQRLVEYYDIFGISCDVDNLDCKICFSFPANIVLLPCRHCCCCLECYKHIEQCPMCRKPIRQTLRWKQN